MSHKCGYCGHVDRKFEIPRNVNYMFVEFTCYDNCRSHELVKTR